MNYFKLKTLCLLEESRLYILDTSPENSKYLHKCQAIPYLEQDSRIEFHNLYYIKVINRVMADVTEVDCTIEFSADMGYG